ncbi:MAG: glycosyltransferase family 4 protein, partial [Deltaproteobacteria bacterium]|nr:glycosyltransferase family 4 protein [Deltaproteobacteria bacterium]
MKVLFIQKRAKKAGAQVCLAQTVRALKGSGVEAKAMLGESGWLADRLAEMDALAGIAPFPSFRSPLSKWIRSGPFKKAVDRVWDESGPFHIVHANDTWEGLVAEWVAKRWGIPWIAHLRIATLNQPHYTKYHCQKADAIIAVSPSVYAMVEKWPHNILEYVPEGITEESFSTPRRSEKSFPETIGVIGHGGEVKGWLDLAAAFAKVEKSGGSLPEKIVFYGQADEGAVKKIRRASPGAITMSFEGHVDDLAERLRGFDIVVAPSRMESFGMAVLETIAAGVPLLASRTGILPYIMEEGGEGSPW